MKFKQYLQLITDPEGFIPTPRFKWTIRQNQRQTAREEAIAGEILKQSNPRENITYSYPWGPEQQMVLQQLWIHSEIEEAEWRDIPTQGASELYSVVDTEFGEMPVPNSIREPEIVRGDFHDKLKEIIGDSHVGDSQEGDMK